MQCNIIPSLFHGRKPLWESWRAPSVKWPRVNCTHSWPCGFTKRDSSFVLYFHLITLQKSEGTHSTLTRNSPPSAFNLSTRRKYPNVLTPCWHRPASVNPTRHTHIWWYNSLEVEISGSLNEEVFPASSEITTPEAEIQVPSKGLPLKSIVHTSTLGYYHNRGGKTKWPFGQIVKGIAWLLNFKGS